MREGRKNSSVSSHPASPADSTVPELPRCSRLLSLATVTQQSPWDLVATFARLEGEGFLKRLLTHYQEDYQSHASTLKNHIRRHYLTTCSLIHT